LAHALTNYLLGSDSNLHQENQVVDTMLEISAAICENNLSTDKQTSGLSVLLQQFIHLQTDQYSSYQGTESWERFKFTLENLS
jgi:uncharacterized coiled-coil protein SlyX